MVWNRRDPMAPERKGHIQGKPRPLAGWLSVMPAEALSLCKEQGACSPRLW